MRSEHAQSVLASLTEPLVLGSDVCVLTLSGSLSPVHVGHIRCVEAAAEALRARGHNVMIGFLVPSSESYVNFKLGEEALSLADRVHLCELAVAGTHWLSVDPVGDASSARVCQRAGAMLNQLAPDVRWVGWQVVGEDFARSCELWDYASRCGQRFVCLPRLGLEDGAAGGKPLPPSSEHFVVAPRGSVCEVSSTAIRSLARAGRWDELGHGADAMLHPGVVAALRQRRWLGDDAPVRAPPPAPVAPPTKRSTLASLLGGLNPYRRQEKRAVLTGASASDGTGVRYTYDAEHALWLPEGTSAAEWLEREAADRAAAAPSGTSRGPPDGADTPAGTREAVAPVLVGISRCSRSGKSTLAERLRAALQPRTVALIRQDRFFSHRALLATARGTPSGRRSAIGRCARGPRPRGLCQGRHQGDGDTRPRRARQLGGA